MSKEPDVFFHVVRKPSTVAVFENYDLAVQVTARLISLLNPEVYEIQQVPRQEVVWATQFQWEPGLVREVVKHKEGFAVAHEQYWELVKEPTLRAEVRAEKEQSEGIKRCAVYFDKLEDAIEYAGGCDCECEDLSEVMID